MENKKILLYLYIFDLSLIQNVPYSELGAPLNTWPDK